MSIVFIFIYNVLVFLQQFLKPDIELLKPLVFLYLEI